MNFSAVMRRTHNIAICKEYNVACVLWWGEEMKRFASFLVWQEKLCSETTIFAKQRHFDKYGIANEKSIHAYAVWFRALAWVGTAGGGGGTPNSNELSIAERIKNCEISRMEYEGKKNIMRDFVVWLGWANGQK